MNGEIYYDNDVSSVEEIGGRSGDATPAKPEAVPVSADRHTLASLLARGNAAGEEESGSFSLADPAAAPMAYCPGVNRGPRRA
ncbi:MAG: hypothetical protein J0H15_04770 [Xanthomonadales bacterium]|nr:hypothetical protein [Xanthomonadales bacterium]